MKLKYTLYQLLFISLLALSQTGKAQDTITLSNGEKMNGKILTVGTKEIEFQQRGSDTGIIYIGISDIFTIKYPNGTIDTTSIHPLKADTTQNWHLKGIEDADANYEDSKTGTILLAATIIATPVLALYPTSVCAKKPPNDKHLNIRDNTLLNNPEYMKGYKDEAFEIKNHKVWRNFITGTVIWVAAVLFLVVH